jgi:hypothetical protein
LVLFSARQGDRPTPEIETEISGARLSGGQGLCRMVHAAIHAVMRLSV